MPRIEPQPGESLPSAVYAPICRSNEPLSSGFTGWVDTTAQTCNGQGFTVANYSVWCPNPVQVRPPLAAAARLDSGETPAS